MEQRRREKLELRVISSKMEKSFEFAVNRVRVLLSMEKKSLGPRRARHRANSSGRIFSQTVTMTGTRKDEDQRVQRRTREQGVK